MTRGIFCVYLIPAGLLISVGYDVDELQPVPPL